MKNLIALTLFLFLGLTAAHAQYSPIPGYPGAYGPCPYPYQTPIYPYPQQPSVYIVTCFAQGLANGALFYGLGYNLYTANQYALAACQSTGQYCQLTGCQ